MINRRLRPLPWKPTLLWKRLLFVGSFLIMIPLVYAQEFRVDDLNSIPGLRDQAIVMNISARIVEGNKEIVWDSENSRITIPGRPVGLRLVGSNVAVEVQFIPYLRPNNRNFLVAQGQVFINTPDLGVTFHTIMETIPLVFGEKIFFFPLGSAGASNEALIEIQLVVNRYSE